MAVPLPRNEVRPARTVRTVPLIEARPDTTRPPDQTYSGCACRVEGGVLYPCSAHARPVR